VRKNRKLINTKPLLVDRIFPQLKSFVFLRFTKDQSRMAKYKQIPLHILGWFTFVLFIVLLFNLQNAFFPKPLLLNISFGIILFYFNYLFLIPNFLFRRKLKQYILLSAVSLTATATIVTTIKSLILFRLRSIPSNIVIEFFLYVILFLIAIAVRSYLHWVESEKKKEAAMAKKTVSELQNLKNQLNPHFLFNSLNSIYSLSLKKSDKSPEAIIMLSELMRYMLYETNEDYVFLEKEIEYIRNYFAIQKLQIAHNQNVELKIQGKMHQQVISPLLLISFIENAFKYSTDLSGATQIRIDIRVEENNLYFNCENSIGNRNGMPDKNSGIGLQNTIDRLNLLYPKHHTLHINENQNTYRVELHLTLNQKLLT